MRASSVTWWLDWGALPDRLIWARLGLLSDGGAEVLDCDGKTHHFHSEEAARLWLAEDEYSTLETLVEEGEVEPLLPPTASSEKDLVAKMYASRR